MKTILILAAGGMAGHVIAKRLEDSQKYNVIKTFRNVSLASTTEKSFTHILDLYDSSKIIATIDKFQPDIVINCAGILIQDSINHPADAIYINSYLPNFLNYLSNIYSFKLIQISTDCVFSGKKGNYTENDKPDADNIYGKTKALGEIIDNNKHLTIRTSIIGPELKHNGTGLLHWLFNQSGTLSGYTQAIWSGVTTLELAKYIEFLIHPSNDSFSQNGLIHLTNNIAISKFDLLLLIREIFALQSLNIIPESQYVSDKSLINSNNTSEIFYTVPSYRKMIAELKNYIFENKILYNHYKIFMNH